MRGLGKGIRSFKDGMNGKEDSTAAQVKEEEKKDDVK
jgi:Sec-independent protein translocase protein TatA